MKRDDLIRVLSRKVPAVLAEELVDNFLLLRQDVMTSTLERASPGKFVETLVQALQALESGGKYDKKPDVDGLLRAIESRPSPLGDGLRICAARIGRAMYSLRSKRGVVHKGEIDPSLIDLKFLHHAAQWVVAEFIRTVEGISMDEAGKSVALVQVPVGGLVEDFGDRKLVLPEMTAREEVLALLRDDYPNKVPLKDIKNSMARFSKKTVGRAVRELWKGKLVEGSGKSGYQLTSRGFGELTEILKRYA